MVVCNNIFVALPLAYMSTLKPIVHPLSASDFPSLGTIAWQIPFCLLIEDCGFYWSHRFLHLPSIYPYVHKIHHKFHAPVGIAAEVAHPLEYLVSEFNVHIFHLLLSFHYLLCFFFFFHSTFHLSALKVGNIIPVALGPYLLKTHLLTSVLWLVFRSAKSFEAHSGYSFPWLPFQLLPFANPAAAHDYHHSTGIDS